MSLSRRDLLLGSLALPGVAVAAQGMEMSRTGAHDERASVPPTKVIEALERLRLACTERYGREPLEYQVTPEMRAEFLREISDMMPSTPAYPSYHREIRFFGAPVNGTASGPESCSFTVSGPYSFQDCLI